MRSFPLKTSIYKAITQHQSPAQLKSLYQDVINRYSSYSLPHYKEEDWRFINLRSLYQTKVRPKHTMKLSVPPKKYTEAYNLVFINGTFQPSYSDVEALKKEIKFMTLAEALDSLDDFKLTWNTLAKQKNDFFSLAHNGLLDDGAALFIPDNKQLSKPIHILYINNTSEENHSFVACPRLFVQAGRKSQATIIEQHYSEGNYTYLSLPVIEFFIENDANIEHIKHQKENEKAFHIARSWIAIQNNAQYHSHTYTFGGKISRFEPVIIQNGSDAKFTLDGLTAIKSQQIADTHSDMRHHYPNGQSHQLHKCIVKEKAHSIFNGKINVSSNAQETDSFQENRNLMLSSQSHIHTKPQLEIFADQVKCSHGATIGSLNKDEIFYIQSRGINKTQAESILTYAFALENIEKISIPYLRLQLARDIHSYIHH